jgi:hypothetical protein
MGPKLREKAQELGYEVIKAAQSHAEGQFIQFLRKRNKGNEQVYTHIIAMGCSRPHCKECDLVLRLLLGERYHQTTAAAKVVSNEVDLLQSIKLEPLDNAEYYIVKQERCTFKILKDVEAISDKSTPNYYVADLLKE